MICSTFQKNHGCQEATWALILRCGIRPMTFQKFGSSRVLDTAPCVFWGTQSVLALLWVVFGVLKKLCGNPKVKNCFPQFCVLTTYVLQRRSRRRAFLFFVEFFFVKLNMIMTFLIFGGWVRFVSGAFFVKSNF